MRSRRALQGEILKPNFFKVVKYSQTWSKERLAKTVFSISQSYEIGLAARSR